MAFLQNVMLRTRRLCDVYDLIAAFFLGIFGLAVYFTAALSIKISAQHLNIERYGILNIIG
ncbi:MAG: hypothetical protein L7F77_10185 [Candidatus Magnetominusculus sp. LBB02]|nr:hypothetical protein [Candidatus Magnetominusculus sp. LBB02]